MDVNGHTVLVTGATRGVGRALTAVLVGRGARVVAVGRHRAQLDALAAAYPGQVRPHQVDLSDPGAVDLFIDELPRRHPDLSIIINNAGVQTTTGIDDYLSPDLRATLRHEVAINLDAVVALSTGLLPHLRRQPAAAIVNITSGLALAPKRSAPVYCATKAAVRAFTRGLRYQCQHAAPQVRVVEVVLPVVDTDMTRGRGTGKIPAQVAAAAIVDGLDRQRPEIYVGKARLLRAIMRISPTVGYRILRDG